MKHGLHDYLDLCRRQYGRVFKIYLGSVTFLVVADPEAARRVNARLIERQIGPQLSADPKAEDADTLLGLATAKCGGGRGNEGRAACVSVCVCVLVEELSFPLRVP